MNITKTRKRPNIIWSTKCTFEPLLFFSPDASLTDDQEAPFFSSIFEKSPEHIIIGPPKPLSLTFVSEEHASKLGNVYIGKHVNIYKWYIPNT